MQYIHEAKQTTSVMARVTISVVIRELQIWIKPVQIRHFNNLSFLKEIVI